MNTKQILIISGISCIVIIIYLHYNKFKLITSKPSIEQDEYFNSNTVQKNHRETKNIFIIRLYSSFDENKKILNIISDTKITAYNQLRVHKLKKIEFENGNNENFNIKKEEQKLQLLDKYKDETIILQHIINGNDFSDNMMTYILNPVKNTQQYKIPIRYGIYSPLSVSKNIFINIGVKLQKIPVLLTSSYDRLFLHVIKGGLKIRFYDPSQIKKLYINYKSKIKVVNNVVNCFNNSKINLENKNIDVEFPKYKQAQFTEIIIREGNLVYIPNFWIFTIEYIENSISLFYTSNTLISSLYNML